MNQYWRWVTIGGADCSRIKDDPTPPPRLRSGSLWRSPSRRDIAEGEVE